MPRMTSDLADTTLGDDRTGGRGVRDTGFGFEGHRKRGAGRDGMRARVGSATV